MDPPHGPPATTNTSPPNNLRIMCSYGGHVTTRPHNPKTLTYVGGETRIITINRTTTASSLSSLIPHLSTTLSIPIPFTLKYLLPNTDLDSLISLVSDEDLLIMFDELDRMATSSRPSRMRLFVFGERDVEEERGKVGTIRHPKTESWFFDALKGARMNCGSDGVAESIVLETSSSFGSTNSSVSHSSSPVVAGVGEEGKGRSGFSDPAVRYLMRFGV